MYHPLANTLFTDLNPAAAHIQEYLELGPEKIPTLVKGEFNESQLSLSKETKSSCFSCSLWFEN